MTSPLTAYRLDLVSGRVRPLDLAPSGDTTWQPPEVIAERRRATSADGTYGGNVGLKTALHANATIDAATGNDSALTLDLADFEKWILSRAA